MFLKGNVKRDFDAFAEDKRRLQSQKDKEPAKNNHTQVDIIVATPDCLAKANINGESWAKTILRKEQELSKHP